MRILVDADGCPVREIVLRLAQQAGVAVLLVTDTAHAFPPGYGTIITVDQGRDSADMKLCNLVRAGDLVVTQDYGVAAMALARGARAVSQNGMEYHDGNMDQLLLERHLGQKMRRAGRRGILRGAKKRTPAEDERFASWLRQWLSSLPSDA